MARGHRPGGVTAVVVLGVIQGLLLLALGLAMVLGRDHADVRARFESGATALLVAGVVVTLVALVTLVVALLLARGSERARSVVAVVNTAQVAAAVYSLVALRDLRVGSVWALALPVAVLWLLYGSEETQEFFAG